LFSLLLLLLFPLAQRLPNHVRHRTSFRLGSRAEVVVFLPRQFQVNADLWIVLIERRSAKATRHLMMLPPPCHRFAYVLALTG